MDNTGELVDKILKIRPQITDARFGAEPSLRDLILNYYKDHAMENYVELTNNYIDELFSISSCID